MKDDGLAWHAGGVSDQRFDELHELAAADPATDAPDASADVLDVGPAGPRVRPPLPDVAEVLGTEVGKVRRMLQERVLIGIRRGERKILCVPAELLKDGLPLPDLQGTLIVLKDSGFSDEEALRWLFTDDDYPGTPVDALRTGRSKTEVRRRAQRSPSEPSSAATSAAGRRPSRGIPGPRSPSGVRPAGRPGPGASPAGPPPGGGATTPRPAG